MAESVASQAQVEVTERRLRPLYEALDYGQHKKALQIAEKILKKQGDLQCAKILKSIALLRLSRTEEANELVAKVMSTHPGDQASLQALTLFYRETGDFQKIAEVYADAAKHYPKNQEILTHLFMAYVRVGDCQKQQQTAALLCKAFPHNGPYHCWRIMSVLLQADDARGVDLAKNMYLPLADKLVEKYFKEHIIEAEAEVRLYLMVLEKMGKVDQRLQVLQGSHGERIKNQDERETMIIETLQNLGRWEEASQKLVVFVENNPDWWSYIKQYLHCQIQLCVALYKDKDKVTNKGKDLPRSSDKPSACEGGQEDSQGIASSESTGQTGTSEREPEGVTSTEDSGLGGSGESTQEGAGKSERNPVDDSATNSEKSSSKIESTDVQATPDDTSNTWLRPLIEAQNLFNRLAEVEITKFKVKESGEVELRGPLLARLELVKQANQLMKVMDDAHIPMAPTQELLMDYFHLFGTKSCVFDDLKPYIDSKTMSPDIVQDFLDQAEQEINKDPLDFDCPPEQIWENMSRLRRYINLIQLKRYHGKHQVKFTEKRALAAKCVQHYRDGVKLGRGFKATASQPADFYILIAAHMNVELYQETGDVSNVWEAVFLLESVSHHNAQISLLLMKLYGHLGATECITVIFNAINIKHIQTESLGYLPARYLQSMGTFGFANQLYRGAFRFFFSSSKEISEYIIQAYKNGVFHKILEMINLRDRLTHSFNFASTMVDMNLMELVTTVNTYPVAVLFFQKEWLKGMPYASSNLRDYCARLVDSRDLRVMDDWSPPSLRLTDVEIKISFDLECLWLRTRVCLVKCLHAAVSCVSEKAGVESEAGKGGVATSGRGLLNERIRDLTSTLEAMDKHVGMILLRQRSKCQLYPVQAPPPCLGFTFHHEGHGVILKQMLMVVESVMSGASSVKGGLEDILARLESAKSRISGVSPDLKEAMIRIVSPTLQSTTQEDDQDVLVTSQLDTEHPYDIVTRKRIDLEEYVLYIQTISHLALLCGVCAELTTPTHTATGGKKKRKKKTVEFKPICKEFVNFMKELMVLLMSVSQSFQPFPLPPGEDDDQLLKRLSDLYISRPKESPTGAVYTHEGEAPAISRPKESPTAAVYTHEGEAPASGDSEDPVVKEWDATVIKVCSGVVSSYNMSFRDTLEVVTAKLQFMRTIVKQLGGHVD